jgi:N-acetylmuramoyl-L-alanine amidase
MKKVVLFPLFFFLLVQTSAEELKKIKLRAARHPGHLRIVIEGPQSMITGAIVNQKEQNIQVTFPVEMFAIQEEKVTVAYKKTARDTIVFYPLQFRGFKVFQLQYPSRLVIDIFLRKRGGWKQPETVVRDRSGEAEISGLKAVVIDAGHGGYEYGIVEDEKIEKNVVLDIAKKLGTRLNRNSNRCFLTRTRDRFLGLSERVKLVNSRNAEVFLSLHVGNHDRIILYVPLIADPVPEKIKPFMTDSGQNYTDETSMLLQSLQSAVASEFGDDMVSVVHLPYSFLAKVEAASLMIEFPSFDSAYYGEEMTEELVNTLYKGIYLYEEKTAGRS